MLRIEKIVMQRHGVTSEVPYFLLETIRTSQNIDYNICLVDSDTNKFMDISCRHPDFAALMFCHNPYGCTAKACVAVDKQAFDFLSYVDEVEHYRSEYEHDAGISYPVPIELACTLWRYGDKYSTLLDMFAGRRFAQGSGWSGDRFHALGQGHDVYCIKFNNMNKAVHMIAQRTKQLK